MADALTDEMPSAREFTLKKLVDVTESDLRQNAVWASYYEPDDFDTLAALGYDPNACREKLEAIDFADSYVFPLPNSALAASFKYLYCAVAAVTSHGRTLLGYRTGPALCLYCGEHRFWFNPNAAELSHAQADGLASLLGGEDIFPVALTNLASMTRETFALNHSA